MRTEHIPVEDRIYVLRFRFAINNNRVGGWAHEYYTGQSPTRMISKAKRFSLEKAKNTKAFAHSCRGKSCEVKRVTKRMLFKAALQGK